MKFYKNITTATLLLVFFTSAAHAEWKFPSFSFNTKTAEQAQLEIETERKEMIEVCKKSIANLYNESIDYPSEFRFNTTQLTENTESKTMNVAINYTVIKNNEPITLNFECDFIQESTQTASGSQNIWSFVKETRSY